MSENWTPSKGDWYLQRGVSYEASPGLPDDIIRINEAELIPRGTNRQYVIVQRRFTNQVDVLTADGAPPPNLSREIEGPDGLRVYAFYTKIASKTRVLVDAKFRQPDGLTGTGRDRLYRLHVLRQPVVNPDRYDVVSWSGALTQDLVLEVRLRQTTRAWLFESLVLRP